MKAGEILIAAAIFGTVAGLLLAASDRIFLTPEQIAQRDEVERSVYYPGCDEVRMLGKAPLYRGQPGYRPGMDGDNDGIACEPYYGR